MITIRVDTTKLLAELSDKGKRQVPYALAAALNRTADELIDATRARVFQRGFKIRSPQSATYLQNAMPYPDGPNRATKTRLRVRVGVGGELGKRARYSILAQLEEGGIKTGTRKFGGGKVAPSVAVPIRRNLGQGLIDRALYPTALGLQEQRTIEGGFSYKHRKGKAAARRTVLQGVRRTVLIQGKSGKTTIFQRTGPGKAGLKPIFSLKRSVRLPARHFFVPTAQRLLPARLPVNMAGMMAAALRTAK